MLLMMIPILRIADNLDRSREQRVRDVNALARWGGSAPVGSAATSTWRSGRRARRRSFPAVYNRTIS